MKNIKSIFSDKKFFIYGFAKSGHATFNFLKKMKADICCWDDNILVRKTIKKKYLFNLKKKKNFFFDFIVVSPGINIRSCYLKNLIKKNRDKVITDLDIFYKLNKTNQIITITGTNGKSTTCKLLEKVFTRSNLKPELVGNIGKPILSVKKINKKTIFIVEASSYQLEYTKYFKSNHAAILNISPDHLERHGTMKNYIIAKEKILKFQTSKDHCYLNLNNKLTKKIINRFKKKKLYSKLHQINNLEIKKILKKIKNEYLLSENNLENISFVVKIAKNYKIKLKIILEALNQFKGLPHRQEKLALRGKTICINDSKATNFESTSQSLKSYKNIFWILGGLPKREDKFLLSKLKKNIIKAYIIGNKASFFTKKIKKEIDFIITNSLNNAVLKIIKDLNKMNYLNNSSKTIYTILFSPAAASFDQFKNFEDRGNKFKKLIYKQQSNIY